MSSGLYGDMCKHDRFHTRLSRAHTNCHPPRLDDSLYAGLQLNNSNLCRVVKSDGRDAKGFRQSCKTIRFVLVIEGIEHLDCTLRLVSAFENGDSKCVTDLAFAA